MGMTYLAMAGSLAVAAQQRGQVIAEAALVKIVAQIIAQGV
jgi:hypothetical protein